MVSEMQYKVLFPRFYYLIHTRCTYSFWIWLTQNAGRLMGLRDRQFFLLWEPNGKKMKTVLLLTFGSVLNQGGAQTGQSFTHRNLNAFLQSLRRNAECRWHGIFKLRYVVYIAGFTGRVSIPLVGTTAHFHSDSPHLLLPPVHCLVPVILVSLVCF